MTFKHNKFEDSPVMRSLEKLAQEKGLIKNDPLHKVASRSAKANLTPSQDLMENLIKLCDGLRAEGLYAFANEIETSFLMYKKAEAMYADSNGEDIINQAHPKGSPKLDVEGDGVVETIIDRHLKMIEVVEKRPTGKLTNAKEIIRAVKMATQIVRSAQNPAPTEANRYNIAAQTEIEKLRYVINNIIANRDRDSGKASMWGGENLQGLEKLIPNITLDNVKTIRNKWREFSQSYTDHASENEKATIQKYFEIGSGIIAKALSYQEVQVSRQAEAVTDDVLSRESEDIIGKVAFLKHTAEFLSNNIGGKLIEANKSDTKAIATLNSGIAWIKRKQDAISYLGAEFNKLTVSDKNNKASEFKNKLIPIESALMSFKNSWNA